MKNDRCRQETSTPSLLTKLTGLGAIAFPLLHTLTDVMEWITAGFTNFQLWLNYAAFLPLPAVIIGLYALQHPAIGSLGLIGALLYGFSFIYFAHTSLYALAMGTRNYAELWNQLGELYQFHGALMIIGGLAFGIATARARVLPRWTSVLFLLGISLNLAVALLPMPEILQTVGSTVRNAGLIAMGSSALTGRLNYAKTS